MSLDASSSSGWHRKWLVLAAALVWLYFLRYRLLGWLLSQLVTLALRVKTPRLHVRAQIHYITLRPLQLGLVEIRGGVDTDWRIVFTRVAVETHVLAFFRSFVQKKILAIAVDDVFVDLLRLDDALVRDLVQAMPRRAAKTNGTNNMMGFMRFLDLRVRSISVNADVWATRTRARISDLCVDIPDVLVPQNLLHLSLSTSSLIVASRLLQNPTNETNIEKSNHDGVSWELTHASIVFDVQLTDQEIIGCTVASTADEPAYMHVDTAYVGHWLLKKIDLIRNDLCPIPKWIWHVGESSSIREAPILPFTLRVADFPVTIELVHRAPGGPKVPMQVTTHIRRLEYAKNAPSHSVVESPGHIDAGSQANCESVRMSLDCKSIELATGAEFARKVVSTTSCRVEMRRDSLGHGEMQCEIGDLHLAVDPSICQVLHSLVLFPDVVDDYEKATLLLMYELVAQKLKRSPSTPRRKIPVQWSISVQVHEWSLQSWLRSSDVSGKRDFEAHGKRTTVHSVVPPKQSRLLMKHQVEMADANARICLQGALNDDYSIQLETVSVSTSKVLAASTSPKSMEVKLSSSRVVLNDHAAGMDIKGNDRPGLLFQNLVYQQAELESEDLIQLGISLTATEADVSTSHSRHEEIVGELRGVAEVLDQVRIMLTPPDPPDTSSKLPKETVAKILDVNVSVSAVRTQLSDVSGVSPSVEFAVNEMKVAYQKSAGGSANNVTCAFVKMKWESDPVMDIAGVRFNQAVDLKAGLELLSDVESEATIDITLSEMQLWLRPERRLLLLFLKLDELINPENRPSNGRSTAVTKKSTLQKVTLNCTTMGIQVRGPASDNSSEIRRDISLGQVKVQANVVKSGTMTDAVLRYLHVTRRHESCRARLADCIQVQTIDGTVSIQSLEVTSSGAKRLHIVDSLLNFATTDVSVFEESAVLIFKETASEYIPSKFLLFDLSATAKQLRLTLSKGSKAAAKVIFPVLQCALDSRPNDANCPMPDEDAFDWRLRYVGSFDVGIQHAVVVVPIGTGVITSSYQAPLDSCNRFIVLDADELAFHSRKFQKVLLQFELLRVAVVDHDAVDRVDDTTGFQSISSDTDLPLQLLYLPRTKLDAAIHWKETAITPDSRPPEQFALSFDLVVRANPTATMSEQVPMVREALCSLNWEYVLPALIVFATEGADEFDSNEQVPSAPAFECVGIQWNVSLDVVQVAWWDAMSQDESAMLVVSRDLLSHGVARLQTDREDGNEPTWVLWEITAYLDHLRAYLLREAQTEDECISLACGVLPFQLCPPYRFFFDTTGTSYRATHAACGLPGDGNGVLFGELAFAMVDKLNDQFTRVEYKFDTGSFLKAPFTMSSQASAPNGSPPKSPRAWTQSVRAKLARLKRRTSSMDNMLLNDGSRPIQVDSMKLLWTIETRDCVFNMIAVIGDSLEAIIEATQQRNDQSRTASVRPLLPSDPAGTVGSKDPDGNDRVSTAKRVDNDMSRTSRRGSTRDSLLELLHQGKLGKKDPSSINSESDSQLPQPGEKSRLDSEESHLPKVIKDKKYTLDVHDVQINMLEETSRSSALIASKRIHLEAGYDESESTAIVTLKFECVTGHVSPLDVEVSSGVVWYTQARGAFQHVGDYRTSSSNPTLLKQVMEEFTLTTVYSQGITTGETAVEVDMSSLQLSTDRHQFYQLLNVLRHVLLAPPTIMLRKRLVTTRRDQPSETSSEEMAPGTASAPSTPVTAHTGKKLHAQLVEELRIRDSKMLVTNRSAQVLLKLISFRSAGCVYRLRTSPESTGGDHEFVEIRADGITGSHSYFANQNTKFVLNLQWMEINNLHPGPSSIAFEDAMAVLKAKLLVDQRYQGSKRVTLTNQKGMLTVRAESGPQTRVLGQKLRILDVLEISIFPEIPNMIVIQLAADFYELVYKFFFEQVATPEHSEAHNGEHLLFGKKASTTAMSYSNVPPPPSPVTKSRGFASPASSPLHPAARRKSIQSSSAAESALTISTVSSVGVESTVDDDDASVDGCELFYFKYVRIGNVRLRINCHGFFVNLNNFDLDLPPFVCQSKLCTWKKLLQKFESHLRWYVTKESASTGLSHFKNKLLKWTPTSSGSEKKDKHKKEDSTAMNAQVLFGPYSGTQ